MKYTNILKGGGVRLPNAVNQTAKANYITVK